MIGTSAALLGSAAISGGASLLGGLFGSRGSKKAAQQQVDAQNQVIDLTKDAVTGGYSRVSDATKQANELLSDSERRRLEMFNPYAEAGPGSVRSLQELSGAGGELEKQFSFNPEDLASDPGYAFTLAEGEKAIQRSAAARGGLFSGSTLKALSGHNREASSTYFNDAFQRAKQTFDTNRQGALSRVNTLQDLARLGYSGTAASSDIVGGTQGQRSQNLLNEGRFNADLGIRGAESVNRALDSRGDSEAAGTVGSTNAILSGVGGATRSIQDFLTLRSQRNAPKPDPHTPTVRQM